MNVAAPNVLPNNAHHLFVALLVGALPLAAQTQAPAPVKFDRATISGLPARNIGSATMSGRIAAVDAVNQNGRLTVFVGAASGGVWKSVNGGTTFKPVFDRQPVQSIGAVAIDPSNPKTVWVGTGEAWTRNSVSVGDGIYKSTDGGENWTNVGLEGFRAYCQDPGRSQGRQQRAGVCDRPSLERQRPSAAFTRPPTAARPGGRFSPARNRLDRMRHAVHEPRRSRTQFIASMWDFRRQGWTFRSGGPGSGLYQVHRRRRALD